MDEKLIVMVDCARKVSNSGDPRALSIFRAKLTGYLDLKQPCPNELFDEILSVIGSAKLASYSEYGRLLGDLAISEFAFTGAQRETLVNCVDAFYFKIDQPICRMQACHLFFALQSRENTALQLLRLLEIAGKDNSPQAELIWELAALKDDADVASGTRELIRRSLPNKS